jgi:hypothetical protein
MVVGPGCKHPAPPVEHPKPSPSPTGDLLRFKANAGDEPRARVSLLIEQEASAKAGDKSGTRKIILSFTLTEEEKVDAVAPDGTAQISSRLVDVSGEAGQGASQQQVDDFALALDELKIQFRRSPRGDVASITMSGVRNPLDDKTARTILNSIFAGGRGPILPEEFVEVGSTWNSTTQVATPFGTSAEATYVYKYVAKRDGVASITCDGALDSQKTGGTAQKRMTGKNSAEYKFSIASGRLVALTSDATILIEDISQGTSQPVGGTVKGRVKVEWAAQ